MRFEPMLKQKVWGGARLAQLGKVLPAGAAVGESWEVADLAATDPSGGGGDAARSVVAAGPWAGRTLADVLEAHGEVVLGRAGGRDRCIGNSDGGQSRFPLLIKYLDAREHLSVQVHPSPRYASTHAGAHLKTECWYIVEAEPGSVIYAGVRTGVTRARFEAALRAGQGEGVVELLEAIPAEPGRMHVLPSGTVHALGAGVLVAEVQTPSDTTFRVYDWAKEYGRSGRSLHVEQALACIDFGPAPEASILEGGARSGRLVSTEFFTVDEHRVSCEVRGLCGDGEAGLPIVVMMLKGMGSISAADGSFGETPVSRGTTVLIPAWCAGAASLAAGPDSRALVIRPTGA